MEIVELKCRENIKTSEFEENHNIYLMYALKAFIIDGDVEMKMAMIFEPKALTAKKLFKCHKIITCY